MTQEEQVKSEHEPQLQLCFVTGNSEKIATAQRHLTPLGISIQTHLIDLPEMQSDSTLEIAKAKAKHAFEKLKKPLIVSDHSWHIPSLNGFPGPYMKYMNQWLTSADFLMLMMIHQDRRIIKKETVIYTDGYVEKIFEESITGKFLQFPQGDGDAAMRVVTMNDSGKSVAECIQQGEDISSDYSIWENFGTWYKETKTYKVFYE